MKHETNNRCKERGNALFLILIAVALFAALSYAVTQSGRGGGSVSNEQALILSSQITQYPAALRTSITRMVVTGTGVTTLDFTVPAPTNTAATEVFGAGGGQAISQVPPPAATSATTWTYLRANGAADGWYIWNIGSNAQNSGREVIAALPNLTDAVCQQINKGLGRATTAVTQDATVSLVTAGTAAPAYNSTFTFNGTPGAGNTSAAGVAFACVLNGGGGGNYIYYHALYEQ